MINVLAGLCERAVIGKNVNKQDLRNQKAHNVTAVGHWRRVSLRRLDVSLGPWHAS